MVSLGSWNGKRIHRHSELITGVLKGELGFEGFVVSDWLGISQLDADPYRCVVDAIGAGVDMAMIPIDYRLFIANVIAAVEVGDLDLSRVDDAVRRILTVKHALGLFSVDTVPAPPIDIVGADEHRTLAREAAAKSAVLLTDPNGVLPIRPGSVLVAGAGADDVGLQCGGWTIEWQGAVGPITQGTTILAGLEQSDAELNLVYRPDGDFEPGLRAPTGIAVIAEPPYAEGFGDDENLAIPKSDVDLIETLRQHVDSLVLVILSGRPLLLEPVIDLCDAVVAAWLPGSEASGIADVLTGAKPFSGRLRRRWPLSAEQAADPDGDWHPLWDYGHGVVS
jgi:beta-glucosidase